MAESRYWRLIRMRLIFAAPVSVGVVVLAITVPANVAVWVVLAIVAANYIGYFEGKWFARHG